MSIIAVGPLALLNRVRFEPKLRVERQAGRVVIEAGQFHALGIVFIDGDINHFLDQTRRNTAASKWGEPMTLPIGHDGPGSQSFSSASPAMTQSHRTNFEAARWSTASFKQERDNGNRAFGMKKKSSKALPAKPRMTDRSSSRARRQIKVKLGDVR